MSEGRQLSLYGPSVNPINRLKAAMRQAIKECRWSRDEICDRMNSIAASDGLKSGRADKISVALLDAWVADSKQGHLVSVSLLPAFCAVTKSLLPLKVLAGCVGADVVDAKESKILALAKLEIQSKRIAKQKRQLQREVESDFLQGSDYDHR